MDARAQSEFEFCQRPVRAKKPERLVFALMLEEADGLLLARFTERFLREEDLLAEPVKPGRMLIALYDIGAAKRAVLYAAKLAGQKIAAAGLKFAFDSIASQSGNLFLQSRDPALAALQDELLQSLASHRLKPEALGASLMLAMGVKRQAPRAIVPFTVTVTGLALLRAESLRSGGYDVLRRWPLNKPPLARG